MGRLGERLTEEMKRQGISAAELARRTDVKEMTLRRIMWGQVEDPGVKTVAAIAKGLNRSIDFLVWDVIPEPHDAYMADVIDFFTYRWPKLTVDEKKNLQGLLRMMTTQTEIRDAMNPTAR